ncbi:MAG: hypothetical protein J6R61_05765 [Bacteroidales bacterium]|nr:hypothetical protein [Bacteroidales bacterium]
MKKIALLVTLVFVAVSAMAQETFPGTPADPGAVPIVESILGLLGLGGVYAYRLFKKGKKED